MNAEDWLNENCKVEDWSETANQTKDFINTSDVIKYMEKYEEYIKQGQSLPIDVIIDNSIVNKEITYKGKDYKIYNVSLLLAPEIDEPFETVYYQKLRDERE